MLYSLTPDSTGVEYLLPAYTNESRSLQMNQSLLRALAESAGMAVGSGIRPMYPQAGIIKVTPLSPPSGPSNPSLALSLPWW